MKKNVVFTALLLSVLAASAFSQSNESSLQKGDFMISGGGTFSAFNEGRIDRGADTKLAPAYFGGILSADYVLPFSVPFTIGIEAGMKWGIKDWADVKTIPIGIRFAWHPYFGVKNLDTYLLGKLGMGLQSNDDDWTRGIYTGLNIGARYFFTEHIGAFLEAGWDSYLTMPKDVEVLDEGIVTTLGITYKF